MSKKRILVLGGGISGLAAAYYASRDGKAEVALWEASGRVGGVLETVHQDGYLVERCADNFATLIPDALQLSKDCGIESMLVQPNQEGRQAFVLNRGRMLPIPAGFSLMQPTRVSSILATPTLSLAGKARLAAEYFVQQRKDASDESLEAFALRRLGREVFENLVEPIVSGIFTADPKTLSMQATMPQFVAMEKNHGGLIRAHLAAKRTDAAAAAKKASGARYDQFVAPKQGMTSWVGAIAEKLPEGCLQLNTKVDCLERTANGRWKATSGGVTEEFDAVICALPARVASELLGGTAPKAANLVGEIEYASSAVVAMIVKKADLQTRHDGFGMIVPLKEGRETLAISFTSNKYPNRTPDDQILLRVFLGGAMHPRTVELSDEELMQLGLQEVREIMGWKGSEPEWSTLVRWNNAMPQYKVGHLDRIAKIKDELSKTPGLQVCGAAYEGVGIPQCVRGAKAAAQATLEYCGAYAQQV